MEKFRYKSTFRFFRVLHKLKLVEEERIKLDLWRGIKKMLRKK